MNKNFPRVLALLRKEKGVSQKQAAADLGISQALLSHYEKGIRECGLDFLVKVSSYYGVSTDYLLGISPDREGATLTIEDLPEPEATGKENVGRGSIVPTLNKKLIFNSLNVLYDLLSKCGDKDLTQWVSDYLMGATYRAFRAVYSANSQNPEAMFEVPRSMMQSYTAATMEISMGKVEGLTSEQKTPGLPHLKNREPLALNPQIISENYALFGSSLLNLIKRVETQIEALQPPMEKASKKRQN